MPWLTSDEFNIVNAFDGLYDSTITTGWPCSVVNLGKYDSMIMLVTMSNPSTTVFYVNNYASLTPSSAGSAVTLIGGGQYRTSNSTGTAAAPTTSDLLSARTSLTNTTSISITANTTTVYNLIIELKSSDCASGKPYVGLAISTGTAASSGMCVNYIMKPRYLNKDMLSALS